MAQSNFYSKEDLTIESGIWDQSTVFNGDILEPNTKIVIQTIKVKEWINYNKF